MIDFIFSIVFWKKVSLYNNVLILFECYMYYWNNYLDFWEVETVYCVCTYMDHSCMYFPTYTLDITFKKENSTYWNSIYNINAMITATLSINSQY